MLAGCCYGVSSESVYKGNNKNILEHSDIDGSQVQIIKWMSVEGRIIDCYVLGRGEERVLIIASMHGNENAGSFLVRRLLSHLFENQHLLNGKQVILIPEVNPDGIDKDNRYNSNGVDLNRNFPAFNRMNNRSAGPFPLSEPESRMIAQMIEIYYPDRIMSIHQPLKCIDYDGPSQEIAEYMSHFCDLPLRKLGAMPGSLGSYAGEGLNIPVITLELTGKTNNINKVSLWKQYKKMLTAFILFGEYAK